MEKKDERVKIISKRIFRIWIINEWGITLANTSKYHATRHGPRKMAKSKNVSKLYSLESFLCLLNLLFSFRLFAATATTTVIVTADEHATCKKFFRSLYFVFPFFLYLFSYFFFFFFFYFAQKLAVYFGYYFCPCMHIETALNRIELNWTQQYIHFIESNA